MGKEGEYLEEGFARMRFGEAKGSEGDDAAGRAE